MRAQLGIPPDATVFARYGGLDTFDIKCVQHVVCSLARSAQRGLWFLFANTQPFCGAPQPRNIVHIGHLSTSEERSRFIRTSDAMLHARMAGETFGNAVAEFSSHNRPVFTSRTGGLEHVRILGERAQIYNCSSLEAQLLAFNRTDAKIQDWNAYAAYYPKPVMRRFVEVYGCEPPLSRQSKSPSGVHSGARLLG